MIDELDWAADSEVFAVFLSILRRMFLERDRTPAFSSVIFAGIRDVRHLGRADSGQALGTPWNIASDFDVDMSFSAWEIEMMLRDYEGGRRTGMDTQAVASRIRRWTDGYPFLVSRLCKTIDETPLEWSARGVDTAVSGLLLADNTLFSELAWNVLKPRQTQGPSRKNPISRRGCRLRPGRPGSRSGHDVRDP